MSREGNINDYVFAKKNVIFVKTCNILFWTKKYQNESNIGNCRKICQNFSGVILYSRDQNCKQIDTIVRTI